jgi:hypothetical protein
MGTRPATTERPNPIDVAPQGWYHRPNRNHPPKDDHDSGQDGDPATTTATTRERLWYLRVSRRVLWARRWQRSGGPAVRPR